MARKVHVTRTYAPLQFEALEPHRFEDLVRGLLHGYRDWQRIEATGRGGSDDGFDIRAYEKALERVRDDPDSDDDAVEPITVEGNLWMIQCKREKQLGATRIVSIIDDAVKKENAPYGYILAAPVNFTKKSYDAFRSALVDRGVLEFQLLGRAELEDMLYQPKNDWILFAFFGISMVSRRRSKITEIRSVVTSKNRLYRALNSGPNVGNFSVDVLIRDSNAHDYPHEDSYPDFQTKPRWRQLDAYAHHPEGLLLHVGRHLAYVDRQKKEWDRVGPNSLRRHERAGEMDEREREAHRDKWERMDDFWDHLPLWQQATLVVDGLVPYRDFDLIDKEGDTKFAMPHLFVEFGNKAHPFSGFWSFLEMRNGTQAVFPDDYTQISLFPKEFPAVKFGRLHSDQQLDLPSYLAHRLLTGHQHYFFDLDDRFSFLGVREVIAVPNPRIGDKEQVYAELMYRQRARVSDLADVVPSIDHQIQQQIDRQARPDEEVTLLQLKRVYEWELERRRTNT